MGSLRVFKKRGIIVLYLLLALSLFLYFYRIRIRDFAIKELVKFAEKSLKGEVYYERIEGGMITGLDIFNLRVITSEGDSLYLSKLSLSYDPLSLLRKRFKLFRVELNSPYLSIAKHRKGGGERKEIEFPSLSIRRLIIKDAKIVYQSRVMGERISGVVSLYSRRDKLKIEVLNLKGSIFENRFKIKSLRTIASLSPKDADIQLLSLATQNSSISLTSYINWKDSLYSFDIKDCRFRPEEFLNYEGIGGEIGIRGKVSLDKDRLGGGLSISLREGRFKEISIPRIVGNAELKGYNIEISLSNPDEEIGNISLKGRIDYKSLEYTSKIELKDFLLHKILKTRPFKLTGDIVVFGKERKGEIICKMEKSIIYSLSFDKIDLKARLASRSLFVDTLLFRRGKAKVEARGALNGKNFDIGYRIADFNLDLLNPLFNFSLNGILDGNGKIEMRKDSLSISGVISLKRGEIKDLAMSKVVAEFNFSNLFDLQGRFSSKIEGLRWKDKSLGSFYAELIDKGFKLRGKNGQGFSEIDGKVSLFKNGFEIEVDNLAVAMRGETIRNRKSMIIKRDGDLILLRDGKLNWAGGSIELEGESKGTDLRNFSLMAHSLDLKRVGRFFDLKQSIEGEVDISLNMGEDSTLELSLKDFIMEEVSLKSLRGRFRLERDRLDIESLEFIHREGVSRIEGAIGYKMEKGIKPGDIDIRADLDDPGIWVFSFLKGIVEPTKGEIEGKLSLKGPLLYPEIDGRVEIRGARIWIPSIQLLCSDAYLLFRLKGHKIILSEARSRVGKGSILATGFIELSKKGVKELRYNFQAKDIPLHPMEGVYAVASTKRFSLSWGLNHPLSFKGNILISSALLNIPFGISSPTPQQEKEDSTEYDIRIIAEKGVWLRNQDCDIEFSLDLLVKKTLEESYFLGSLKTKQGRFYYLDNVLRITEGSIVFLKSTELNPALNIKAELLTDERVNQERIKIVLHLLGTLREPRIELSSIPPVFSQEDIISYLNFHRTWGELSQEGTKGVFTDVLSEKLLWYFGKEISSEIQKRTPIDYLRIEPPSPGELPIRVTVGKYIAKNLFLTYTHNILDVSQDQFKVEYSFGRNSQVIGEKTPDGHYRVQYRFSIRY